MAGYLYEMWKVEINYGKRVYLTNFIPLGFANFYCIPKEKEGYKIKKRKWSIEEVDDYRRMHNMYFYYYNKGDGNLLVPKMSRIGYTGKGIMGTTANLAHPVSKICALVLLILAFLPMFLKLFSIIP